MPAPGFRRSLPLLDLSPAESTQIRIDPEQELVASQIALEAAKAGAFGGPVAGNIGRSMVPYEDWLRELSEPDLFKPLVFRGLRQRVSDPMAPNPSPSRVYGKAAYASPSFEEALSYSGPEGAVYPIRLEPDSRRMHRTDPQTIPPTHSAFQFKTPRHTYISDWNMAAEDLPPGRVLTNTVWEPGTAPRKPKARPSASLGPYYQYDFDPLQDYRGGGKHLAWTEGTRGTAMRPIKASEAKQYLDAAAERLGRPIVDRAKYLEALADGDSEEEALSWATDRSARENAVEEIANDPRIGPTRGARTARFLKGMVKEALKPKNILLDALVGSGVGAGSALAGYAAGQPRSAGVFNLPGEYRQTLSQEDLLAQIEAKTARKEVLRQQYIDEVNALHGEGTLQPGARIEEISDYLGPVRGLQGR
jgi:hypothetical protein